MNTNALSVANYFIELAQKEGRPIHLLGLVKRVYIAHGFALALLEHGLLDPRFDKVEAWKYGPVIPSVYHSFKQYRVKSINEQTVVMVWDEKNMRPVFNTPNLTDKDEKRVVEMVWKRYKEYSDNELVTLTHMKGTPWDMCFIKDENVAIPDILTENYYRKLIERIVSRKGIAWES
jgi:uncharacterized phage-associated protein